MRPAPPWRRSSGQPGAAPAADAEGRQGEARELSERVLKAAIAAEMAAANCRPMFIQMLEAEIERRNRETSQ
jgi:hypothetical protein